MTRRLLPLLQLLLLRPNLVLLNVNKVDVLGSVDARCEVICVRGAHAVLFDMDLVLAFLQIAAEVAEDILTVRHENGVKQLHLLRNLVVRRTGLDNLEELDLQLGEARTSLGVHSRRVELRANVDWDFLIAALIFVTLLLLYYRLLVVPLVRQPPSLMWHLDEVPAVEGCRRQCVLYSRFGLVCLLVVTVRRL